MNDSGIYIIKREPYVLHLNVERQLLKLYNLIVV